MRFSRCWLSDCSCPRQFKSETTERETIKLYSSTNIEPFHIRKRQSPPQTDEGLQWCITEIHVLNLAMLSEATLLQSTKIIKNHLKAVTLIHWNTHVPGFQ